MAQNVKAIPDGYNTLTPYLYVRGAARAIDFYTKAFGAEEKVRMPGPDGTVGHAEMQIGDSMIMLADNPDRAPQALNGTTFSFFFYVEDVDAAFKRALAAGAKELQPLTNKFYGDRIGVIADPFGHEWSLAQHIEDVSPEEMQSRAATAAATMGDAGSS